MPIEEHLLFAVLAFEDDLIDLPQLTSACRAWAGDKSKPLADLLVERGWVSEEDRGFLERKAERKLAKHGKDPYQTLNSVIRGDVRDALRNEVDDADVRQSLSSWPSVSPLLIETTEQIPDRPELSKSRYTWVSEVGSGGLGKVWLARDNDLAREVALKEIQPGSASSEAMRRLIKEAQITGQLQHPGIVPVYEVRHGSRPFYTMKLVRGETFARAIGEHHEQKLAGQQDPRSERRLLSIFLSVCDAIAYANSRGVIHRDLKPDNIVLGDFGEAIVLDWGLARQVGSDDDNSDPIIVTEVGRTDVTMAGQRLGTPAYMSPEAAAGRVDFMDRRTDVYGLGAILFELLSGRAPHGSQGRDLAELLKQITDQPPPRLQDVDPSIPQELSEICARAMAIRRDDRYQTATELKAALLDFEVHEESIELAARAAEDLDAARKSGDYDEFHRARFGFETALEKWPENEIAINGFKDACDDFARAAFERGDYDLALSLLDETDHRHDSLRASIERAAAERSSRAGRIRHLRQFSLAASLSLAVLASVAAVWINSERTKAQQAQSEEATQRRIAQRNEREAKSQRRTAERNGYYSDMRLAQMNWEANEFDPVLELLGRHENEDDLKGFEWNYFHRLAHGDLLTLPGHFSYSVSFSPDGTRIASAGSDKTVKVWSVVTGDEIMTLSGHASYVRSVSFSPDGSRLASASDDKTVKVWDAITGKELLTLSGHGRTVKCVSFSHDATRIASASEDRAVKVWDATTGRETLTFKGHAGQTTSVSFSPDGNRIASGSTDGTVMVWDPETGNESLTLKGHIGYVNSVSFSPDGTRIASAGGDRTVRVWDATTGEETFKLEGHTNITYSVAFSPDGTRLASVSNTVKVWDAATGKELFTIKGRAYGAVAFSPDGTRLASPSYDQSVKIWDAITGQEALTLSGHAFPVNSVAFSPDGTRLASASDDRTAKVWDVAAGQQTITFTGHAHLNLSAVFESIPVNSVAFSPDGTRVASASFNGTVKVWNAATGKEFLTISGGNSSVQCVAFSPDGTRLASAHYDGAVVVWDANTGQETLTLKRQANPLNCVVFSPDGTRLATASGSMGISGDVKLWDATTGQELLTLGQPDISDHGVAFSPDGSRLAAASFDRTVKVWDADTGQLQLTLKGHASSINSLCFSPDGTRIASASYDKTVKLWDATTGQETLTLKGHTGSVLSVAFSPDGMRLASASQDGTVRVWDANPWTPQQRAEAQARAMLTVTRDRVDSLEELQAAIRTDQTIGDIAGDQALGWSELVWKNYPAELYHRAALSAQQGRLDEAASSAARMEELKPPTSDNWYLASRAYSVCASAAEPVKGKSDTDEQPSLRTEYADLSLSCFDKAVEAGLTDFHRDRDIGFPFLAATGNWETVLHVAEKMPVLLYYRAAELSNEQRFDDAAKAAEELRRIAESASHGKAERFYEAACAFGRCAFNVQRAAGGNVTEELKTRRNQLVKQSLACLKDAKEAGFNDNFQVQSAPDLSVLRNLREFQKMAIEIGNNRIAAEPDDVRARHVLATAYDNMGSLSQKAGRIQEALGFYQHSLFIRESLFADEPDNVLPGRMLILSHNKLGDVQRALFHYAEALRHYRVSVEMLDRHIDSGQSVEASRRERSVLQRWIESTERSIAATGDWQSVVKQAAKTPELLYFRTAELAKQKKFGEAAVAAAKLRELGKTATDGQSGMLYNAACAYAVCAASIESTDGETSSHVELSLECLKEAIEAGYEDFDHARKDPDLKILRDRPEFLELVPAA